MDIQYKIDCIIESLNSLSNMEIIYEKFDDKIQESYTKLKEYDSHDLSSAILNKYKNQYHNLSHVKINNNTKGKLFTKNNKVIALINTEKKENGEIWIQGIEVFGDNKGQGLSRALLDICVKNFNAKYLSVRKTNKVALKLYESYVFKTYNSDKIILYMKL